MNKDKLKKAIDALSLTPYIPSVYSDAILTHWWNELVLTGDLENLMIHDEDSYPLSRFLQNFSSPTILLHKIVDNRIVFAYWLMPFFKGALIGIWGAPELRGKRDGIKLFLAATELAFTQFPTIVAYANDYKMVEKIVRFGGRHIGHLDSLTKGKLYISQLNHADFQRSVENENLHKLFN